MTDYIQTGKHVPDSYALNPAYFLLSGNILNIIFNIVTWENEVVCVDGDVVYYD